MLWKGPNPTQRIASVSVQQGPSHRPPLADWRRDCSPEGTHVIPREQYDPYFVLKSQKIEKLEDFVYARSYFIHTRPELNDDIDCM